MTVLSSADDNARKILTIYEHFNSKPGQVLDASNFLAVGGRRRWTAVELQQGLEVAVKNGWLEAMTRGFRLTDSGYAEL